MAAIAEPATQLAGLGIYMRVSSEEQRAQGTIETQRSAADRWLAVQDITPYGWYPDDGVSGTVPFAQRPEGARLLADALAGHIKTLVVWRLDRLGRNALAVLQAVEALERAGIRLVSITESFDTSTPAGRLQLNMLATIAQFERDSIVQRSTEGAARRLHEQGWMGSRAPYGYRVEGKDREARLRVCEELIEGLAVSEAGIIRLIYHLAVEQGLSCQRIAEHLNARGSRRHTAVTEGGISGVSASTPPLASGGQTASMQFSPAPSTKVPIPMADDPGRGTVLPTCPAMWTPL
jgi:site-specific DNA recombinase